MADTGGEDNKGGQATVVVSHIKANRLPSKKVLTIVGVVLILIVAGCAGAVARWAQNKKAADNPGGGFNTANTQTASGLPQSLDDIQNLRLQGKDAEAQKKTEEALSGSNVSDSEKYQLYIQQGNVLIDKQDYVGAIAAYGKADAIKSTYETNSLLAETWKDAGNKTKAIEYYKKALPLIPRTPVYEDDKASLEQRIRDLEG